MEAVRKKGVLVEMEAVKREREREREEWVVLIRTKSTIRT
jgi:hypothetical protein